MVVTNYSAMVSLRFAKERIKNPPFVHTGTKGLVPKPYEHHVGSWAFTMVSSVFNGPQWIITGEKIDETSKKRPDIVVEEMNPQGTDACPYLFMELKANNAKDRFEDAVAQVVSEIANTMESKMEAYVVVQHGTKIAFFEYHNDVSNLDEEDIPHFKGCVSLTQSYLIGEEYSSVINNLPDDLDKLYHNYRRLKNKTEIRTEAALYDIPCVFDIDKHEYWINFLFHPMVNNEQRSSI